MFDNKLFIWRLLPYFLFVGFLVHIQYFVERHQSIPLLLSYSSVFLIYLYFLKKEDLDWKEIVVVAILARLVLFFGLPNLSDDFYRFIWDGKLLAAGINPFSHVPEYYHLEAIKIEGLTTELYHKLNSRSYFTIYPSISQFIFWLSVKLNPIESILGSVFIMRLLLISFEIGSLYLIYQLLKIHQRPTRFLSIYALNPLAILELTGNLHFEGVMIFFLLLAIYFFYVKKYKTSAISIAAGIATKLTPLMVLPIFIKRHDGFFKYFTVVGLSIFLFFLPILNETFFNGITNSLSLFFKNFEFNGGLFFLIREIGFYIKGYDIVQTLGPVMSLISLLLILSFSSLIVKKKTPLECAFIIIFFIQLLFATTVHPWYIIPMIALSATTPFKFPILWSFLIFFTYIGYSSNGFEHPFLIIILEYTIVVSWAFIEIRKYIISKIQISNNP